jgi:hypothetical protein
LTEGPIFERGAFAMLVEWDRPFAELAYEQPATAS